VKARTFLTAALLALLAGCAGDTHHRILISAADQRMVVFRDDEKIAEYPVSTSKYGLGSRPNSNATPVGLFRIKKKIGEGAPAGAVFKSRRATGEIIAIDAPGRDPIVTRILWLDGLEPGNKNSFDRLIYIHGTPEERNIGFPASYGCIRMKSVDVISLYETVGTGAKVLIIPGSIPPQFRSQTNL
jgi:lipoprotein-anchoring transpeptidase ErfK/SrfK